MASLSSGGAYTNQKPDLIGRVGAANQIRTDDLILTKDVLYQLSHSSICEIIITKDRWFVKQFFKFAFFMLLCLELIPKMR